MPLCPGTPKEIHNATAIPDQTIQPLAFLLLIRLPLPQFLQQHLAPHDHVRVQPQEHRHPHLSKLVVSSRPQPCREGPDEVYEFVGPVIVAVAYREGSELEVRTRGGEGLEVLDECIV